MFSRLILIIARRLFRHWSKLAGPASAWDQKTRKLSADVYRVAAGERLKVVQESIVDATNGEVAAGLFKGMKVDLSPSWGDGAISAKLLGCYEAELLDWLEGAKDVVFDRVVNIGSAEGYYAVGAALALNTRGVIAVDIDPAALAAVQRNAAANGVQDKIETRAGMDAAQLGDFLAETPNALVISDCEGFELSLFTPEIGKKGARASFLIECHDFIGQPVTDILRDRLKESHDVQVIEESARDPNRFPVLRGMDNLDRWLAVCEFRPQTMRWIAARPKAAGT